MKLRYSKYSGAGNTFYIFDNRNGVFPKHNHSFINKLCLQKNDSPVDGILLLESSELCDFRMLIFNRDGNEAEMCGNGIRCLAKFLQEIGIKEHKFSIETLAGCHQIEIQESHVLVKISNAHMIEWNQTLTLEKDRKITYHLIDTGVPHAVIFSNDGLPIDLNVFGPLIRNHPKFHPKGVNVSYAQLNDDNSLSYQTYERGVEEITLACGTGACAVAIMAVNLYSIQPPINVIPPSGDSLFVNFKMEANQCNGLELIGPADKIGEDEIFVLDTSLSFK